MKSFVSKKILDAYKIQSRVGDTEYLLLYNRNSNRYDIVISASDYKEFGMSCKFISAFTVKDIINIVNLKYKKRLTSIFPQSVLNEMMPVILSSDTDAIAEMFLDIEGFIATMSKTTKKNNKKDNNLDAVSSLLRTIRSTDRPEQVRMNVGMTADPTYFIGEEGSEEDESNTI